MNSTATEIQRLKNDQQRMRREALIRRVLYTLGDTVRVIGMSPDTDVESVRVEFTDASARVIAPLCEAVNILEAIIWASDGCMGHRQCAHSMEPWQRARKLLTPYWRSAEPEGEAWPDTRRDI